MLHQLTDARILTTTENDVEVAHEAVLREWPRLRELIEDDRRGLATCQLITAQAVTWGEGGRLADDLLRARAWRPRSSIASEPRRS